MILRSPTLKFHRGRNITVRMGTELAERFSKGDTIAEIYLIDTAKSGKTGGEVKDEEPAKEGADDIKDEVKDEELTNKVIADVFMADIVPFSMIRQEQIEQADYPGVKSPDDLYKLLSLYYGQFDCEALMSVIYFIPRE